ncbi:hypothetical protein B0T22DRAFT_413086 [Podospora appendiculata]|uniref:FAR1 domain-containing protein n=1 Tax=Podospora appendiculata TaxID=314037 RepID=A0AAE1C7U0_9PEZI|nr:hypothetical protein B0T22DRAFT_413086 [Podospora appendiculata]
MEAFHQAAAKKLALQQNAEQREREAIARRTIEAAELLRRHRNPNPIPPSGPEPAYHQIQPNQQPRTHEQIRRDQELFLAGQLQASQQQAGYQPQPPQYSQSNQPPPQHVQQQQQQQPPIQHYQAPPQTQQPHAVPPQQPRQDPNPQANRQSNHSYDETLLEETMQDDEDDDSEDGNVNGDGDGDGGNDSNNSNSSNANGQGTSPSTAVTPHVAPLTQPVTALKLPSVRPTLMLGPYETRESAMNAVQEYAISQGYMLVQSGCAKAKSPGGKYTSDAAIVRVDLMCDRGGICKNSGTGVRKRPTHKIGCPCRLKLVCKKRQACKWFIEVRCEEHNHDLNPHNMNSIASYRRWRRVQSGGQSLESHAERYSRLKKPKVLPPVPAPKFHNPGPQPAPAPTSPVHMAALKGQSKILEILLNKGANINALDSTGRTPLHCAVEGERMDTVKLLLDRGADMTCLDSKGISALHVAVEKGMEDAVILLIDKGADPNK